MNSNPTPNIDTIGTTEVSTTNDRVVNFTIRTILDDKVELGGWTHEKLKLSSMREICPRNQRTIDEDNVVQRPVVRGHNTDETRSVET